MRVKQAERERGRGLDGVRRVVVLLRSRGTARPVCRGARRERGGGRGAVERVLQWTTTVSRLVVERGHPRILSRRARCVRAGPATDGYDSLRG